MKKFFLKIIGTALIFNLSFVLAYSQTLDLTIGSYNIRYDNKNDRPNGNGWDHRLPVISSLIQFIDYDILGCQEVLINQLEDLTQQLPGYAYVGVGRQDGKDAGEFAPIFYKKDMFNVLDSGNFWLSETPDKPSKGWDAALPRICTYIHLEEKNTGKKLWFFNLHMDHVGTKAREESSKLVVRRIKDMLKPHEAAVLTGDFNVDQNNPIYNIIEQSGVIRDSYVVAPLRYAWSGTFNAFDTNLFTDSRIDHVFVTEHLKVKNYAILTESYRAPKASSREVKKGDFPKELSFKDYEAKLPSDHFPIVVKAKF
ncbi:endonuclease/exonuclease/phosphatase family protein [Sphingobacterium shayense]|uniref:endonuclease/exonuclease/phosphatase family protein n=1 Tax=Sphingobacterium shayense TaxID=626343 RepID=UPI001554E4E9|nr:endonuclease/exonuclease/phosphatase family protein [Sphingobacterium shayense]NQD71505.1 endonuclease/exonuclease/phosphatase family protein [Sphingobacterium shayense]